MPPKRKATKRKAPKAPKTIAKKAKNEFDDVKTALTKGPSFRKKIHSLDKAAISQFSAGTVVVDDYDCMLNQTNIDRNNNKYYVIQLLRNGTNHYVWTRWGRVGEPGSHQKQGPFKLEGAVKAFEKKFNDKTKNDWAGRNKFKAVAGKYTLLEMGDDTDEQVNEVIITKNDAVNKYEPSKLDKDTQMLIDLIFQTDTFNYAMQALKLDTKKLPLGKLSKPQIMKGFEALEELEAVISKKKSGNIKELSSKFYTIIPHSFGRSVPPAISTLDEVREKMDMLIVLSDIESTQALLKSKDATAKGTSKKESLKPNPLDENYKMLDVNLELLNKNVNEFSVIEEYVRNTKGRDIKIINAWKVDRPSEVARFRVHKDLANRKLLWHGTNIAVVAAILKSGLRIMPHSGGRVGKGIYFASENGKSAGYVGCSSARLGVMFLNEVALGKEHPLYQDDGSLIKPPNGFDSVVAQGRTEPDSKFDKQLNFDGNKVTVPVGKPQTRKITSSFWQSEYLVYKESQCRIRYLLLCQF